MLIAADSYFRMFTGQAAIDDPQKLAYRLAAVPFGMAIGKFYGETYFSKEAIRDITDMADKIVLEYIRRLREHTWLSEATINIAIAKLKSMKIKVGYPDKLNSVYETLHVGDGTVFDNFHKLMRLHTKANLQKCGKTVDREEWLLSADMVNALNHLISNTLYFPAAILQEPFYSLKYSQSRNYGAIGAIIAHEITHAFDTNGAKFDEYGNIQNWWTEADYTAFKERTRAMTELFDGIPFANGKIDGELTVAENVSDAGGLSCALEILKKQPGADLNEFFEGWATIWRMKATPELEQLLLTMDTHAPGKLRTNVQAQNLDDFYEVYDVQKEDEMYLDPQKRVKVW
jgi:putative endopeptidase